MLIQKFVKESRGRDIRALVIGDRVVAAMRRVAQPGEFRSNVHQGGSVEGISLDPAYENTAIRAAQIMGLRIAGVDMLESDEGPSGDGGQLISRLGRGRVCDEGGRGRGHHR